MENYTFDLEDALGTAPLVLEYDPTNLKVTVRNKVDNSTLRVTPPVAFEDESQFQLWSSGFFSGVEWVRDNSHIQMEEPATISLSSFSKPKEPEVTKNVVRFSGGIYSYDFIVSGNLNNEDIVFNSSKVEGIPALVKLRGHGDKFACELINCIQVWGASEDQDVGDDYILPLWCQGEGHFNLYTSDYPGVYLQEGLFLHRSRGEELMDLVYEVEQVYYKYNSEIDFIKVKKIPVNASLGPAVPMS